MFAGTAVVSKYTRLTAAAASHRGVRGLLPHAYCTRVCVFVRWLRLLLGARECARGLCAAGCARARVVVCARACAMRLFVWLCVFSTKEWNNRTREPFAHLEFVREKRRSFSAARI